MPELKKESVRIDPNAINTRIMLPNVLKATLKQHKYSEYLLQGNERIFVLKKQMMDMPVIVLDFLQKDRRYKDFILEVIEPEPELVETEDEPELEAVAGVVLEPVVDVAPEIVAEESSDAESIFDIWQRSDIEAAKLNGDEGLKAYAKHFSIDLGDAKRADDVRTVVLEWFDSQL